MQLRSLRSPSSSLINYKEVDRLQFGTVITISLRTSSKKSATSAAAWPLSSTRVLSFSSPRNRATAGRNSLEVVLVFFNAMKLSGRAIVGLVLSSSDWSMEMLTMADVYPTESEEELESSRVKVPIYMYSWARPSVPMDNAWRFVQWNENR